MSDTAPRDDSSLTNTKLGDSPSNATEDVLDPDSLRAEVRQVFAEGGTFSKKLKHYSPRKGQIQIADAVAKSLENPDSPILMIEAGTGTGKTFSYMVPPVLSNKRIIVSTGTKALQDQLTEKDIPNLLKILDRTDILFMALKGHVNYICRHMLEEVELNGKFPYGPSDSKNIDKLMDYISDCEKSLVKYYDEKTVVYDKAPNFAETKMADFLSKDQLRAVTCDSLECQKMRRACAYYNKKKNALDGECFITAARKLSKKAGVITINHALFFACLGVSWTTLRNEKNSATPTQAQASQPTQSVSGESTQSTQGETQGTCNKDIMPGKIYVVRPDQVQQCLEEVSSISMGRPKKTVSVGEEASSKSGNSAKAQGSKRTKAKDSLLSSGSGDKKSVVDDFVPVSVDDEERSMNFLENPEVLVFDEAHQVPEVARSFYTRRYTRTQLLEFFDDLRTDLKRINGYKESGNIVIGFENIKKALNDIVATFCTMEPGSYDILDFKYLHVDGTNYVKIQKELFNFDALMGNTQSGSQNCSCRDKFIKVVESSVDLDLDEDNSVTVEGVTFIDLAFKKDEIKIVESEAYDDEDDSDIWGVPQLPSANANGSLVMQAIIEAADFHSSGSADPEQNTASSGTDNTGHDQGQDGVGSDVALNELSEDKAAINLAQSQDSKDHNAQNNAAFDTNAQRSSKINVVYPATVHTFAPKAENGQTSNFNGDHLHATANDAAPAQPYDLAQGSRNDRSQVFNESQTGFNQAANPFGLGNVNQHHSESNQDIDLPLFSHTPDFERKLQEPVPKQGRSNGGRHPYNNRAVRGANRGQHNFDTASQQSSPFVGQGYTPPPNQDRGQVNQGYMHQGNGYQPQPNYQNFNGQAHAGLQQGQLNPQQQPQYNQGHSWNANQRANPNYGSQGSYAQNQQFNQGQRAVYGQGQQYQPQPQNPKYYKGQSNGQGSMQGNGNPAFNRQVNNPYVGQPYQPNGQIANNSYGANPYYGNGQVNNQHPSMQQVNDNNFNRMPEGDINQNCNRAYNHGNGGYLNQGQSNSGYVAQNHRGQGHYGFQGHNHQPPMNGDAMDGHYGQQGIYRQPQVHPNQQYMQQYQQVQPQYQQSPHGQFNQQPQYYQQKHPQQNAQYQGQPQFNANQQYQRPQYGQQPGQRYHQGHPHMQYGQIQGQQQGQPFQQVPPHAQPQPQYGQQGQHYQHACSQPQANSQHHAQHRPKSKHYDEPPKFDVPPEVDVPPDYIVLDEPPRAYIKKSSSSWTKNRKSNEEPKINKYVLNENGFPQINAEFRGIFVSISEALYVIREGVESFRSEENETEINAQQDKIDNMLCFISDLMTTDRDKAGNIREDFIAWVTVINPNRRNYHADNVTEDDLIHLSEVQKQAKPAGSNVHTHNAKDHKLNQIKGKNEVYDNDFLLTVAPIEIGCLVGPELRRLSQKGTSIIFASATITNKQDFSKFCFDIGLTINDVETRIVESPFNYAYNARIYYSSEFLQLEVPNRMRIHMEKLKDVINAAPGGIFVLTTSYGSLSAAEVECKRLFGHKRKIYVQGKDSLNNLTDSFKADGNGILIGTTSFWEGIDVPGPALSLVIIDKLPFKALNDPVNNARGALYEKSGGSAFFDINIPEAIIRLRQGIGRLIRNERDLGGLIILDPRIVTKKYGKEFIDAMPPMTKVNSIGEMIEFFNEIKQMRAKAAK